MPYRIKTFAIVPIKNVHIFVWNLTWWNCILSVVHVEKYIAINVEISRIFLRVVRMWIVGNHWLILKRLMVHGFGIIRSNVLSVVSQLRRRWDVRTWSVYVNANFVMNARDYGIWIILLQKHNVQHVTL